MRKLRFLGQKYSGDGLTCYREYPYTCEITVSDDPEPAIGIISPEKADQLLNDFPGGFVEILDPFLEELKKVIKNPKYREVTKDMINDYAAKYLPELELKSWMKKKVMAKKVLEAS